VVTHTRTTLVELMERHGLRPSRALGQNFVVDPNTVRRIVRLAGVAPGERVVEIGAGLGSLTLALAEAGARVDAIEVDRHLIEPLREVVEPAGVSVHHADAREVDYAELLAGEPATVVANLPYNVATPLLVHLLETQPLLTRYLVMVQHEVGERLAAHPGEKAFGAVSLKVAYYATAEVVGRVGPTVFLPRPRVESALVRIVRRERVAIDPQRVGEAALFKLVRTAFAQRRKMLRRSLEHWATEGVFERAGVDPTRRPEELTLEEFARLAEAR
jgi:16S rRNA (adenine1518-N6/adenine1519-N6)-dimethyltransferase